MFDIEAKSEQPAKLVELNQMFQNLLKDRFKLLYHEETRELPIYVLTVDKAGSKLQPNGSADEFSGELSPTIGKLPGMAGAGASMALLCDGLSQLVGAPVSDRTGLKGYFDFKFQFAPDLVAAPGPVDGGSPGPPAMEGPSIFSAVREQLGLRLEGKKGPVTVLVIDRIERPSPE